MPLFFDSWAGLLRVVVISTSGYFLLIVLLRVSGKRTLAKMNLFDFVVTIAIGSLFASFILSDSIALAEGMLSIAMLAGLQYFVSWLSVKSDTFQQIVKGTPTLLFYQGEYLHEQMVSRRVAQEEIRFAVRSSGVGDLSEVAAVIMETDGTFSVIPANDNPLTALQGDVDLPPEQK